MYDDPLQLSALRLVIQISNQQGSAYVRKHKLQLIAAPALLAALLVLSVNTWNVPVKSFPLLLAIDSSLQNIGMGRSWSSYEEVGQLLIASMLITQTTMAGYHYAMQPSASPYHAAKTEATN